MSVYCLAMTRRLQDEEDAIGTVGLPSRVKFIFCLRKQMKYNFGSSFQLLLSTLSMGCFQLKYLCTFLIIFLFYSLKKLESF